MRVRTEVVSSGVKAVVEKGDCSELVSCLNVGITQETAVKVGKQVWFEVELASERVLGDPAVKVMLYGIFRCATASEQAKVSGPMPSLESPVSAPAVPECAKSGGAYSRRSKLLQQLQACERAACLPSGS